MGMIRTRSEARYPMEPMGKREPRETKGTKWIRENDWRDRGRDGNGSWLYNAAFAADGQRDRHQDTGHLTRNTRQLRQGRGHGQTDGWMDGWMDGGWAACGRTRGRTARAADAGTGGCASERAS